MYITHFSLARYSLKKLTFSATLSKVLPFVMADKICAPLWRRAAILEIAGNLDTSDEAPMMQCDALLSLLTVRFISACREDSGPFFHKVSQSGLFGCGSLSTIVGKIINP